MFLIFFFTYMQLSYDSVWNCHFHPVSVYAVMQTFSVWVSASNDDQNDAVVQAVKLFIVMVN